MSVVVCQTVFPAVSQHKKNKMKQQSNKQSQSHLQCSNFTQQGLHPVLHLRTLISSILNSLPPH